MIKRELYMKQICPFINTEVLSLEEFDMSRNGIKHYNIREFLLMDEWR